MSGTRGRDARGQIPAPPVHCDVVKEHLRSQIEDAGRPPELTANEVELVRFIRVGQFDWDAYLAKRPGPS